MGVNAVRSFHNIVFSTSTEVNFRNLTMYDMANYIESSERDKAALIQRIESLEQLSKTAVAFSAAQTKVTSTKAQSNVLFDKVYTNLGAAYNAGSGVFTSPLDGYYQFAFSGLVNGVGKLAFFRLHKNDTPVSAVWSSYTHSGEEG